MIYLDSAATTKPCEAAINAAVRNMTENFGNASSLHRAGIGAELAIKEAKRIILGRLGQDEGELFFTSGATESNNTAIFGAAAANRHSGNKIVTSAFEHPSAAAPINKLCERGYEAVRLAPKDHADFEGAVIDAVDENTFLVSVMWVNNETGFITDLSRIYAGVKRKNPKTLVHADAVQGFCKLSPETLKADLISISAHKIHGIKGMGALYAAKGARFEPLLYGGGQQKNLRPGTEPVDLIAAFAAAAEAYPDCREHYAALSRRLRERLSRLDGITFNSYNNSQNIFNFSVSGVRSEIMLHHLEESGIYVSSGSACSKGKTSAVLPAFGVSRENADSAIRASFCPQTSEADIDALADGIESGIARIRKHGKR